MWSNTWAKEILHVVFHVKFLFIEHFLAHLLGFLLGLGTSVWVGRVLVDLSCWLVSLNLVMDSIRWENFADLTIALLISLYIRVSWKLMSHPNHFPWFIRPQVWYVYQLVIVSGALRVLLYRRLHRLVSNLINSVLVVEEGAFTRRFILELLLVVAYKTMQGQCLIDSLLCGIARASEHLVVNLPCIDPRLAYQWLKHVVIIRIDVLLCLDSHLSRNMLTSFRCSYGCQLRFLHEATTIKIIQADCWLISRSTTPLLHD